MLRRNSVEVREPFDKQRSLPRSALPLMARPRPAVVPASFAQARLWFLHKLEGANPAYNITVAFRVSGRLDAAALGAAIDDVRARHESLRTRIVDGDDGPRQEILSAQEASTRLAVVPTPCTNVLSILRMSIGNRRR